LDLSHSGLVLLSQPLLQVDTRRPWAWLTFDHFIAKWLDTDTKRTAFFLWFPNNPPLETSCGFDLGFAVLWSMVQSC
jgi:hypothetical protein